MKLWQQIKEVKRRLDSYRGFVEYDEEKFVLKWDRWPFLKPGWQRAVWWSDVRRIDVFMIESFVGHYVGLGFDDGNKKWTCVYENRKGYADFVENVAERFTGFNRHNFEEIEKCFPSDNMWLPCWHAQKEIGDLDVKRQENVIVWKKGASVFLTWAE